MLTFVWAGQTWVTPSIPWGATLAQCIAAINAATSTAGGTYAANILHVTQGAAGAATVSFVWNGVTYTSNSFVWGATNTTIATAVNAATGPAGQTLPGTTPFAVTGGPFGTADLTFTAQNSLTGPITAWNVNITPSGQPTLAADWLYTSASAVLTCASGASGSTILNFTWNGIVYTTTAIVYGSTAVQVAALLSAATGPAGQTLPASAFTAIGGPFSGTSSLTLTVSPQLLNLGNISALGHADTTLTCTFALGAGSYSLGVAPAVTTLPAGAVFTATGGAFGTADVIFTASGTLSGPITGLAITNTTLTATWVQGTAGVAPTATLSAQLTTSVDGVNYYNVGSAIAVIGPWSLFYSGSLYNAAASALSVTLGPLGAWCKWVVTVGGTATLVNWTIDTQAIVRL